MKTKIILILIFSFFVQFTFSQISHGGMPNTYNMETFDLFSNKLKSTQDFQNGVINITDIDKEREKENIKKLNASCENCRGAYYGKEIPVGTNFFEKAIKQILDNGDKLWILNIKSGNAEGYQFIFNKFHLSNGSKLYIYNEDKSMLLGSFTSENNREDNRFVTQFILGNSVYIEYFEPKAVTNASLSIDKLVYIFDNLFSRKGPFSRKGADSCEINTSCPQGSAWSSEIKSVALILEKADTDYWGLCTGTLINKEGNYNDNDNPFFLTANHCYQLDGGGFSDVADWVFLFRHESQLCSSNGSEIQNNLTRSAVGAVVISRDAAGQGKADYLLLKLKNKVVSIRDYDIGFAGWNNLETAVTHETKEVTGIHHPNGDVKKISISRKTPISSGFDPKKMPPYSGTETHWKVIWDEGITAPGSSGSPLFNSNHELIGILTGGFSFCETEKKDKDGKVIGGRLWPDFYGKLSKGWSNGKLEQYLTPSKLFSLAAYEPTPNLGLIVKISSNPSEVWVGSSASFKAVSSNGVGPITWYCWINKKANDFANYEFGSGNCYNEHTITSNKEFTTGSYPFPDAGNYKVTLLAFDAFGHQTEQQYSLIVAERKSECISANIYQIGCGNQIEFPLGSTIQIFDYAYVSNEVKTYQDVCNDYKFLNNPNWYPKFQGISKIKWFYDNNLIKEYSYNTTQEYQDYYNYTDYNYPGLASALFPLTSKGEHTIRMEAYGGKLSRDGYQYFNPLIFFNEYSTVTKKIVVVDCNESLTILTKTQLASYNGAIKSGNIKIEPTNEILINSGENQKLTAYTQILLKPGLSIKTGANVSLKVLGCPAIDCNSNQPKSASNQESKSVIQGRSTISNASPLTIYPNPNNGQFAIDMQNLNDPVERIEIYNATGALQQIVTNPENSVVTLDMGNAPADTYFVRVICKNKIYVKKMIKL